MKSPNHTDLMPDNIVAFIGDIFGRHGADSYLGEQVTTYEHMLQGALLAEEANAPDALIAGILLHDIGHYVHPDIWHEGLFPIYNKHRFLDRQGRVHGRVSCDFGEEFGVYLSVPLAPP